MKTYFMSYDSEVKKEMYTKGCKIREFDRKTTPVEAFQIMTDEAEEAHEKKIVVIQFYKVD